MPKKIILITTVAAIIVLGVFLRFKNIHNVYLRSPDEMVYTRQAAIVALSGAAGIRFLVREHSSNPQTWIYPPPIRTGYIWTLAAAMRISGRSDVLIGVHISVICSCLSLALLALIGIRFFNPWVTLYSLLFMSVSPMELAISRRAWQDSMFECAGLSLVYLMCEIGRDTNRKLFYTLFTLAGFCCILIKESGIVVLGLCALWPLIKLIFIEKSLGRAILFAASIAAAMLGGFSLIAHSCGGISPAMEVFGNWQGAMLTDKYALEYQSGPWYQFLQGFWIMSPLNAFFCLIGIASLLIPWKKLGDHQTIDIDLSAARSIILFMTVPVAIVAVTPHFQNLRYVSAVFAPFYLIGGIGFSYLFNLSRKISKPSLFYTTAAAIIVTTILFAGRDYIKFENTFVKTGILDLSIKLLKTF